MIRAWPAFFKNLSDSCLGDSFTSQQGWFLFDPVLHRTYAY
jgi:hypothetical protein